MNIITSQQKGCAIQKVAQSFYKLFNDCVKHYADGKLHFVFIEVVVNTSTVFFGDTLDYSQAITVDTFVLFCGF